MIRKFISIILALLFIVNVNLANNDWTILLNEGDKAYANKDYNKAIEQYESALNLIAQNENSATLHYNLGNAYYKNNKLGKAILNWEKAKILIPKDIAIHENLRIAKAEIKGEVIPIKSFFLQKWWNAIQSILSSSAWAWIGIVLLWLGITGILLWMFHNARNMKKYGFIAGLVFIILSVFPFIWSFGKSSIENTSKRGILTTPMTQLRSAPDGASDFDIYEGTEVEIIERLGEWTKVRLLNSDIGWVKETEYEKI